jgi:hypothetical protein
LLSSPRQRPNFRHILQLYLQDREYNKMRIQT